MRAEDCTKEDFESLPLRPWNQETECWALVIVPTQQVHDSGYRCMYYVACDKDGEALFRIAGGSDVLHLDGIGGYGYQWLQKGQGVPQLVPPSGWSLDCLKKSGLLRLFSNKPMRVGHALSSVEVFTGAPELKTREDRWPTRR